MKKRSRPQALLVRIESHLKKLNPPVEAFESSIRTTPFRVLISVLISSRTKDEVTLQASKKLFGMADTPAKMNQLGEKRIAKLIYPVGFFRQKASNIMAICQKLIETGGVPDRYEELIELPGVGRKTANLVMALAFDCPSVAVDTHVFRISRRLGWARGKTPGEVETELRELFPVQLWNKLNKTLVGFGQTLCKPRKPECESCPVRTDCPYFN
jgi:endonuclease-3